MSRTLNKLLGRSLSPFSASMKEVFSQEKTLKDVSFQFGRQSRFVCRQEPFKNQMYRIFIANEPQSFSLCFSELYHVNIFTNYKLLQMTNMVCTFSVCIRSILGVT